MTITASKTFTIEEYLELEERSLTKHEYHNGKILEMAGGTTTHNQLTMTVGAEILIAIRNQEKIFQLYSSDMKIWIENILRFVYPDAVTVADQPMYYNNRRDIITNPLLIVEVSSTGTDTYDRNGKFDLYRTLPSFQEYLIVSQEMHHVSHYFREAPDLWRTADYFKLDEMIPLQSMGVEISMLGIYRGVELA
ncbi:MAG TPA: Uma2 family endonuclease [Haliscomenobacter sp.]|uniref:Uma2 family endonuclease n=1 Tax=Haliscomenobacter sp. TaxID=2717303 RepID=UPI002C2F8D9D|nr:Uma2 family endonuclease [Haliscomenobacter sp.]HOY17370.1 Uma2 family endonuclease [Haliscomenobacter sp.]